MQLANPIAQFFDLRGQPLQGGYIYIGEPNTNPVANPISVYADAGLTVAIAQPIRTINGSPVLNGQATLVFMNNTAYSLLVLDHHGQVVITNMASGSPGNSAISGPTSARPQSPYVGQMFFDTTLGMPVFCSSLSPVTWVVASGVSD